MSDRDSAQDVTVGRAGIPAADQPPSPDRFIDASSPRIRTGPPAAWRVGVSAVTKPIRREPVTEQVSGAPVVPDVDDAPTGPVAVVVPVTSVPPAPVAPVVARPIASTPFVAAPPPVRGPAGPDGLDAMLVRSGDARRVGLATRLTRMTRGRKQFRQRVDDLERTVAAVPLGGPATIAVVGGKGGIGKTTVTACLGTVLAELRPHDGVVAVDADTAFGKLGSRLDPRAGESFQRLLAGPGTTFADVRDTLGHNVSGLSVCAGGASTGGGVLEPKVYRAAMNVLVRHFALSLVDCSTMMDAAVTAEVLGGADTVIVVSSASGPGAEMAHRTVEWIASRDMRNLLNRSIIVVNDIDGRGGEAGPYVAPMLPQARSVAMPFDRELRSGAMIGGSQQLAQETRLAVLELASAVLDRIGGHALR